jgi:hypothetical protein
MQSIAVNDNRSRCVGVRVCGCAGVRVCGCAGVRVCGCAGVRVCGCAGVRVVKTKTSKEIRKFAEIK